MLTGRKEHDEYLSNLRETKVSKFRFPQILVEYFEESAGSQQTTKNVYVNTIKRFAIFLYDEQGLDIYREGAWSMITDRHIINWIKSIRIGRGGKEISSKTLNDYLQTIDNLCKYLVRRKILAYNPCPTKAEMKGIIPVERKDHVVTAMTTDEVNLVAESIRATSKYPARDECIFRLGVRYGLRAQALSEIDISDIDLDAREMIVIEKGNYTRRIKIGADTVRLIQECIAERTERFGAKLGTDALFVKNYKGISRITKKHIAKLLENNTEMLDKHVTPHKMRSTCITVVYERTNDIFAAARKAGHRNIKNTMLYINTDRQDMDLAEDIDDVL